VSRVSVLLTETAQFGTGENVSMYFVSRVLSHENSSGLIRFNPMAKFSEPLAVDSGVVDPRKLGVSKDTIPPNTFQF